jgi:hypothetical protein
MCSLAVFALTLLLHGPCMASLDNGLDALGRGDFAAAGVRGATAAWGATAAAHADRCSASGAMEGERFTASHCAIALYGDQHSVAIWFNADPITPDEVAAFEASSYAADNKGGKPRTMLQVMFCPGGGSEHASAGAVKSIDLNTGNAKPMVPGVQWVLTAPAELKIEKLSGEVKPGGALAGHLAGTRGKTTFTLDFDLALPARNAAAGMNCGVWRTRLQTSALAGAPAPRVTGFPRQHVQSPDTRGANVHEAIRYRSGIHYFRPAGEYTLVEAVDAINGAIRFCRAQAGDRLLINTTAMTGVPIPNLIDRFLMVEEWAETAEGEVVVVLVVSAQYIHPQKFGMVVARHLGLTADVYDDEPSALLWLKSADTSRA